MLNLTPDGQRGERCHRSQGWEKVAKDRRRILVLFCVTAAVTGTREAKCFGVSSVTWRWWRNPRWHRLDYIGVSLFRRKSGVHQARRSPLWPMWSTAYSSSITHTDLMHRRVSFKGNTSCCPGKDGVVYRTSTVNVKHVVYCKKPTTSNHPPCIPASSGYCMYILFLYTMAFDTWFKMLQTLQCIFEIEKLLQKCF